jgi:hypothetical protein
MILYFWLFTLLEQKWAGTVSPSIFIVRRSLDVVRL